MATTNLPSYQQRDATVTARAAEYVNPDVSFANGGNFAGACAPGIGINTGFPDPKVSDWTLNDQGGNARTPQNSQHIGGNALGDGSQDTNALKCVQGADVNDTLSFVTVAAQADDGQGMLAGNTGTVNRTGATVTVGQRVWGTDDVA